MSIELKIKAKSLADEARTIRAEELKLKAKRLGWSDQYRNLHLHRTGIVRHQARLTHLARAFIAGMPYRCVEGKVRPENELLPSDYQEIARMVKRYETHPELDADIIQGWTEVTTPAKAA